jgi:FixJ family two-component response regulator
MRADARVYVVDDDPAMRRSVAFLAESVGWAVTACDSAEAFLAARPAPPGCVVLDVRMPTMSGLELQQALHARGVALPIIFVTAHADVSLAVQAMKQGAFELLEKPFRSQELLDAIAQAVRHSSQEHVSRTERATVLARYEQLTPREREVAVRVARGQPNRAIAEVLGISAKTVQVHRQHVLEKLEVHSAAELAALLLPVIQGGAGTRSG